jgi:hypothetical protein
MKKIKLLSVFAVLMALILPASVGAQDIGGSGNGLSISPTRNELVIERGESATVNIQVKNVSNVDIQAKAYLNDFEPDGTTGNPKIIIDEEEVSSSSLREFIIGLEDVFITAGETANVAIFVQIPEDAAPGAYYGAVRFTSTAVDQENAEDSQLSLNASVASLILVEVPGDITERIEISNISAYLNDKAGSLFTKIPNKAGVEINNLGNGFSKPFGKVVVNGPWGRGVVYSYELNDSSPRGNILPNSTRLFLNDISGVSWPGRYTIDANISHGRGGEVLTANTAFWYIPTWFIIVVVSLVLLVVVLAVFLYRKYVTKSTKRKK